jgi:membrane protein DedA with SNARE-associated domain
VLHQIIESISAIATALVNQFGLFGIFLGMVLESACIPLPSEVIMLTGGFFAQKGNFSIWEVALTGVIGNEVGSILIFIVGFKGARSLLERYGKYLFMNQQHLMKAELWFSKYGEWTAFIGRNIPFIRTFISLPAGIAKMNFTKFCIYTFLGCLPWNFALTYLGYSLGENWKLVESYVRPVSYGVLFVIIACIARFIYKAIKEHKKKGLM